MEQEARDLLVEGARRMQIALSEEAVARFGTYLSLLQRWGGKINLTSRLGSREIVTHHFLDSLAGEGALSETADARVVDIGCGAGLPSLPLKFVLPALRVTLVDSVRKKIAFCQEVIRETAVTGVTAFWGRAEEIARAPGQSAAHDWVVSRALAQSSDVVRLALPFLVPGGRVLLYKGAPEEAELDALDDYCGMIGAAREVRKAAIPFVDEERTLIIVTLKR